MRSTYLLACAAVFAFPACFAQDAVPSRAEAALSNDTLQLRYVGSGNELNLGTGGYLDGAFFLSEERDVVISAGAMVPAQLGIDRLTVAFGGKGYAALLEDENSDVFAVSVGTELRFDLERRSGLAIVGQAFYAPDILTFGAADNLVDLSARAEIRLAPRLTGFAGMRWFEFDLVEGEGERTLQEEVFVGIGYRL